MEGTRKNFSGTEEETHARNQIKETFLGTEEGNHTRTRKETYSGTEEGNHTEGNFFLTVLFH
jgi:hypothetical protein